MVRQTPDARLAELGITLPPAGAPLASYVPMVVVGDFVFVSGHGPLDAARRPVFTGQIGTDLSDTDADEAARLTTLNLLATLANGLGTLNVISRVLALRCFLVADASSAAHLRVPHTIDQLLESVFGEGTGGCCTTIGISGSVLNLPITVDLIGELNRP